MKPSAKTLLDVADRSIATFAQAFFAIILITGLSDLTAVKTAAVAGGLAVAKFLYTKTQAYLATPPLLSIEVAKKWDALPPPAETIPAAAVVEPHPGDPMRS